MEKTKWCSKCEQDKPFEEFSLKNKERGTRFCWCKPCYNVYKKKHYEDNKADYISRSMARKKRLANEVRKLKDVPCADCRGKFPLICMDFDHLPEYSKEHEINEMIRDGCSLSHIKEEIKKCEVVCSNCHRIRTKNRRMLPSSSG